MADLLQAKQFFTRSGFDRRSGMDRREVIDLLYLEMPQFDRRRSERRKEEEKRKGWIRYTHWGSIFIGTDLRQRLSHLIG